MRIVFALLSVMVLVAAIIGFKREYSPAIALQARPAELAQALTQLDMNKPPASARILRDLVSACADALRTKNIYVKNAFTSALVDSKCARLANITLERSPSFSRAQALALLTKPLDELSPEAYHRARMSASDEPWPLSNRLLLAERLAGADLLPKLETEIRADITTAMKTNWGREFLSDIWVRQPKIREMIISIATNSPPEHQRHFLNLTTRALKNG